MGLFGLFNKSKKETLDKGLEKTKQNVFSKLARAVAGKSVVDDDVLDNLEEILVTSDVGVDTTIKIIRRIEERVARDKYVSTSELNGILKSEIAELLTENNTESLGNWELPTDKKPYVILVVGVNGVGKTTTIGKLAYRMSNAHFVAITGTNGKTSVTMYTFNALKKLNINCLLIGTEIFERRIARDL